MKTKLTLLLLLLLSPGITRADNATVILENVNPGTYVLRVTIDHNGKVTAEHLKSVTTVNISPTDGETDNRYGLSDFVSNEAAKTEDKETATALSAVYLLVAKRIDRGDIKDPQRAIDTLKRERGELLSSREGAEEKWSTFLETLEKKLESLNKSGKIDTASDVSQAFKEISEGLK